MWIVFWVVTPRSFVGGYQGLGGTVSIFRVEHNPEDSSGHLQLRKSLKFHLENYSGVYYLIKKTVVKTGGNLIQKIASLWFQIQSEHKLSEYFQIFI